MLSLIVLIEDRIETVFKDEHHSKAETPIDVINEGIVIKKWRSISTKHLSMIVDVEKTKLTLTTSPLKSDTVDQFFQHWQSLNKSL